jgi:hypothetical protein
VVYTPLCRHARSQLRHNPSLEHPLQLVGNDYRYHNPLCLGVPIGIIFATTNIQIGLNVITEFIIGYMLPGRPLAMMIFKTYGMLNFIHHEI